VDISCLGSNDLFHPTKILTDNYQIDLAHIFLAQDGTNNYRLELEVRLLQLLLRPVGMMDQLDLQYNLLLLLFLVEGMKDHQVSSYNLL